MPILRQGLSVLVGGVKAFLDLEAGVVRDTTGLDYKGPRVERARSVTDNQDSEVERLRGLLAERDQVLSTLRSKENVSRSVRPERLIWIFGTGRSGNTWLSSMMEEVGHAVWREPSVGRLFGEFYYHHSREGQRGTANFILGNKQREAWLGSIRNFVLDGANSRFPMLGDDYLAIKEQVGSVGAPLLMEALPESQMILLIRDPRDVVASWMDATRKGGWRYERLDRRDLGCSPVADEDPTAFAEERATHYLKSVSKAKEAYEKHAGRKVLVRYEELRADTLRTVRRIHSELDVPVDNAQLARTVERHAWENVPVEEKGKGRFRRKAQPGTWREDLTEEQVEVVERITAPLIRELYS